MTFKLNSLRKRPGIDAKALGRGIGSGCGKTSSYGHKGAKARSGRGAVTWFEGGQMPIYRRMPKRGFKSLNDKKSIACINLCDLQKMCDSGVLKANQEIDIDVLRSVGAARANTSILRVLGKGYLNVPLSIKACHITASAVAAIQSVGGKAEIM